jgi:hypothetical protein
MLVWAGGGVLNGMLLLLLLPLLLPLGFEKEIINEMRVFHRHCRSLGFFWAVVYHGRSWGL